MIQAVDSFDLAAEIDRRCREIGKVMPVLIEVNIAREPQKAGTFPENAEPLLREIAPLSSIRIQGLMTIGPMVGDPEGCRPLFRVMKELFDHLGRLRISGVEMKHLSMGMSHSYRIAVEEGATMLRIGTAIFGERR